MRYVRIATDNWDDDEDSWQDSDFYHDDPDWWKGEAEQPEEFTDLSNIDDSVRMWRSVLENPDRKTWEAYLNFFGHVNRVIEDLSQEEVNKVACDLLLEWERQTPTKERSLYQDALQIRWRQLRGQATEQDLQRVQYNMERKMSFAPDWQAELIQSCLYDVSSLTSIIYRLNIKQSSMFEFIGHLLATSYLLFGENETPWSQF